MSNPHELNTAPWQSVYDELEITSPSLEDRPLGSYVEEYANSSPDSSALQYFDRAISYAELNAESNKLANVLVGLGVTQGDVIGFHMPNIPQYAIALVAATKLGCAGSGVSPLMTADELSHQIQDAGMKVLISMDSLLEATLSKSKDTPECLRHVICVSAADYLVPSDSTLSVVPGAQSHGYLELLSNASDQFTQAQLSGDSVMMVQYTGGTTGRPKGAELTIRNLMNNAMQTSVYSPWDSGVEVIHTGFPMFHAAGLAFITFTLRFGGLFILIPNPRDIDFICAQLATFPPTRFAAVPSLYQMLVNDPAFSKVDFSQLKTANTGAAPMSTEDRQNLEAIIGQHKLSDMFGMTETGPVHVCNPQSRSKAGSVGIPVPLAETRIVDLESGKSEMPIGETGEIITTGPQLMKGYLNLPEESGKAMREWRGRTWMYTGDVGYMDDEGYIYVCDRAKDMLIVGGFKVFSIEVEDKMQSMPLVASSAVIGQADEARPGNDIVNLYVELTPDAKQQFSTDAQLEQAKAQILEFCREKMAPFKVPKKIHFIDAIPLTSVGKIDKKSLRV